MYFLSRFRQPSSLPKNRQRSRLPKKWTAQLLCLLILVGAEMALPAFSQGAAGTSQPNCKQLQEQVNSRPPLQLPILRQRLTTTTNQVDANGDVTKVSEERIDFVDVEATDLFAVPPGSPLIVANPPYPYQYKQACWGNQNRGDEILKITSGPGIGRSTILMPQPPGGKQSQIWDGMVWNRSRDLVVMAESPTPEVVGSSTSFDPGQPVKIRLKIQSTSPTTANNNQGGSNSPVPVFNWILDPGLESFAALTPTDGNKSVTLTLPAADKKLDKVGITIDYDGEKVGVVSFAKGPDGKWTSKTQQSESLYFRRESLPVSSRWISRFWAILAALLAYLGISSSVYLFNARTGLVKLGGFKEWRHILTYLNPVVVTAGPYGKASLSRLQLLWFTIVVLSVLVYLLNLTGDLSDLPGSVLVLLGISAAGTVGTLGVDGAKNRLSFVNWQWLNDQGWLSEAEKYGDDDAKSKQAKNYGKQSHWRDLLLDEGGVVNVYKFQLLFTSLLVGVFLILSGGSNLRGFRLPENFPQLLGISNLFYVFGRSVQPTGFDDLGRQITSLIGKEKLLKTSVSKASDPIQRPELLDEYLLEARSAAGMTKVLFSDLADTKFDHKPPIEDKELLPPWAQKYENEWLSPSKPASPKPADAA
jgi:hypothetical protein